MLSSAVTSICLPVERPAADRAHRLGDAREGDDPLGRAKDAGDVVDAVDAHVEAAGRSPPGRTRSGRAARCRRPGRRASCARGRSTAGRSRRARSAASPRRRLGWSMFGGATTIRIPCVRAGSMRASASSIVVAIGFSTTRCLPACRIASEVAPWSGIGVRLTTRSMSLLPASRPGSRTHSGYRRLSPPPRPSRSAATRWLPRPPGWRPVRGWAGCRCRTWRSCRRRGWRCGVAAALS